MVRLCWLGNLGMMVVYFLGVTLDMARAQSGTQASQPTQNAADSNWHDRFQRRQFESASSIDLPYRLLAPQSIEPGQTYPLVLFLHGAGERGDNNEAQLVHGLRDFAARQSTFPAFVVAPQCPAGKKWVEVDWGASSHLLPQEPSEPLKACYELLIQLKKELPIDPRRIYVTGLSMGGYGTFDAATRWPELFAAAAPICGGGDSTSTAIDRLKSVPLWIAHGDADQTVPVGRSRAIVQALKHAGATPHYVEMPGVEHDSWTATYASDAFHRWLFKQQRSDQ